MDLTLSYRALASGQVDLIAGDATAGLIKGLDLFSLEDNRHYFRRTTPCPWPAPPRYCGIPKCCVRWKGWPDGFPPTDMQAMNDAVDAGHQDPSEVVRRFLAAR